MKHNILLVTKNVIFHFYLVTWIARCCFFVIMRLFWQQPVKNTRQTFMNWRGGLLFDREILSELLQKSVACPRRCFVRGVRIQESRWTGFHIHSFMVRVFDCFDRGSFTVLLQPLIVTDRQQTDVFVKFRHLTHERCHSSRKQVCKFCVSGGSSGPEGRLEIGALSLNGMERGELTMIDVQEIAGGGARKVETKEGTENNCLPWGAEDDGGGWMAWNPTPEAKKFNMRSLKFKGWAGMPPKIVEVLFAKSQPQSQLPGAKQWPKCQKRNRNCHQLPGPASQHWPPWPERPDLFNHSERTTMRLESAGLRLESQLRAWFQRIEKNRKRGQQTCCCFFDEWSSWKMQKNWARQ